MDGDDSEHERHPRSVCVEFDDGDNGLIALDNVRFLVNTVGEFGEI